MSSSRQEIDASWRFKAIRQQLQNGRLVMDSVFDQVFPLRARRASSVHWTPVEIALRVTHLLALPPGATLLDVGAGVGKFCLVAGAAVSDVNVRGVEHRPHFVEIARAAARQMALENIDVHCGTLASEDPSGVDALYLFNPFAENLSTAADHLDETVELTQARFWRDIAMTERFLAGMRSGARVVTYCGWGGTMPAEFKLVTRELRAGSIELWIKSPLAEAS